MHIRLSAWLLVSWFAVHVCLAAEEEKLPWQVNEPIATVHKETYKKHSMEGAATLVFVSHVGPKLQRREVHGYEIVDDVHTSRVQRFSDDNGRTWSEFSKIPDNDVKHSGYTVWEGDQGTPCYDADAGVLVDLWLRQIQYEKKYHMWTYYRVSKDFGRTWSTPKQLRYENGPEFDPANPVNEKFLQTNQGYFGTSILKLRNGQLLAPLAHTNVADDPENFHRVWKLGSVCMLGTWDAAAGDYSWRLGARVSISPEVSGRGLMEPDTIQLADGRVLVVWRGMDTKTNPGHKYFSISSDSGQTLSAPQEWKYDDGTSFYSPSSLHRFLRHSQTGKLYWLGNISAAPPRGDGPRYPLILAEVDEQAGALIKTSVTSIDDRQASQTPAIQFSNFSFLENRESHDLEIYLTCYGEFPGSVYTSDNYKYVVKLKK